VLVAEAKVKTCLGALDWIAFTCFLVCKPAVVLIK
jgi:hypothetical protein